MVEILNGIDSDYHIHSSNFSDGLNTIDEIVRFAGEIGMKEIAITDHSDVAQNFHIKNYGFYPSTARAPVRFWKNVFNDVNVIFGIEADLLNKNGDICDTIQGRQPEFISLSVHSDIFSGEKKYVTNGLIKAIEKNYDKIKFVCHLHDK